jgi:hypothetical protein
MKPGQRIPRYNRGVYRPDMDAGVTADPVRFRQWYDSSAGDVVINRIAADTARALRPGLLACTDPLSDGCTYGQFDAMDILQNWFRIHGAPRDPLTAAVSGERLKAHRRHKGSGEIWMGPQLGSKSAGGKYAAPADAFEEALWLSVAFGARGITCWGYDTLRWDNERDLDTWGRLRKFRDTLLGKFPWILEAEDAPRVCAVLMSKTNLTLTDHVYYEIDYNYGHFYNALLTAHVPTDVLYDEDVLGGALGRYKALFLPGIEHLTPELESAIADFEKNGGRVIRWPFIRLIYLDYEITKGNFREKIDVSNPGSGNLLPHQYREWRRYTAGKLFEKVADLMEVRCDNPDVIINVVEARGRKRVLLVNDSRTYGQWCVERGFRWSEDAGKPATAKVTIATEGAEPKVVTVELPPAGFSAVEF